MLVLITYDVNTETPDGRRRLRHVAKQCLNYGQRVQNSVFECDLTSAQYLLVRQTLEAIINKDTDSIRLYKLGDNYKNKIEHFGAKSSYDPQGVLMI